SYAGHVEDDVTSPDIVNVSLLDALPISSGLMAAISVFPGRGCSWYSSAAWFSSSSLEVIVCAVLLVRGRTRRRMDGPWRVRGGPDRKSTRLNSSHVTISYAVFCLKKKIL